MNTNRVDPRPASNPLYDTAHYVLPLWTTPGWNRAVAAQPAARFTVARTSYARACFTVIVNTFAEIAYPTRSRHVPRNVQPGWIFRVFSRRVEQHPRALISNSKEDRLAVEHEQRRMLCNAESLRLFAEFRRWGWELGALRTHERARADNGTWMRFSYFSGESKCNFELVFFHFSWIAWDRCFFSLSADSRRVEKDSQRVKDEDSCEILKELGSSKMNTKMDEIL